MSSNNRQKTRQGVDGMKPKRVLPAYNEAKKGVNLSDQMSSYFSVLKKMVQEDCNGKTDFNCSIVNTWVLLIKYQIGSKKVTYIEVESWKTIGSH